MKAKHILSIFFLLSCFSIVYSQKKITWKDLAKVTYEDKYFAEYDEYFKHPTFSESVKELDGKQICIEGYFLDIDPEGTIYILSKGPMSACFFCGIGGPETAIELYFDSKPTFKTDEIVEISGILELNDSNVEHFNYIIRGCSAKRVK